MNLLELIHRAEIPSPWAEGDGLPWADPGFSERMLVEHLSQTHDMASRRAPRIERHVAWIQEQVRARQPGKVKALDLGCGPGLYSHRMAGLGHTCVGIDFAPAAIRYATEVARTEKLSCTFLQGDLREVDYGHGYDLVMLIFGEFNVFQPAHARNILTRIFTALAEGGTLLLEPHTWDAVHRMGMAP